MLHQLQCTFCVFGVVGQRRSASGIYQRRGPGQRSNGARASPPGGSADTAHTGSGGDAADAPTGQRPKWPKEQKPEVASKMHDLGILRFAAKVFGFECYGFVTDWASFFMQFATAPEEHWKSVR